MMAKKVYFVSEGYSKVFEIVLPLSMISPPDCRRTGERTEDEIGMRGEIRASGTTKRRQISETKRANDNDDADEVILTSARNE